MRNRFDGKTALVTGGNSGIGLATALAFAREGARVVITGRDPSTLEQARAQLGAGALAMRSDAGRVADASGLAETLGRQGIRLDAVFINAGVVRLGPLDAVEERIWDETFDTNVKGPYFLLKALAPLLNSGAAVVLNGSINAHIGMPSSSVYSASKAALISLARTLSAELLPRGVRVNVISPGPVQTPIFRDLGIPAERLAELGASILAQIPLKRLGRPEEIASAVLYLASPESAFIVGTELVIDGGMSQL
jgi:NAD(P)-dependent dehydrogenase (short-subunit alcohol dehydrogenase family)